MFELLKKIKINPLFWFVLGMGILTGYFREVIMVFSIVFIHEMGHSIAAQYYNWRIKKIELLPFGGVAEVEEYGNRPLKEEFIVIISGPLQHLWLITASFIAVSFDFWTVTDHKMFIAHNLMILLFNLLPIWPLDGGKLMYLMFSKRLAFQNSLISTLKTSFTLLCIGTLFTIYYLPFHLNLWIVLIFLYFSHYLAWKQKSFAYMRFLMERYYQPKERFIQTVPIVISANTTVKDALKKFRRGVKHKIIVNEQSYSKKKFLHEKDLLHAFFNKKMANQKVNEVIS